MTTTPSDSKDDNEMDAPNDHCMNAHEVADYLQVPVGWVWANAKLGKIPSRKLGHYRRFLRHEIDTWLASGGDGRDLVAA